MPLQKQHMINLFDKNQVEQTIERIQKLNQHTMPLWGSMFVAQMLAHCNIKGQPTFESIRFAFIDPKSRIKKFSEVEVLMRFDNFLHSIEFEGVVSGFEEITDAGLEPEK